MKINSYIKDDVVVLEPVGKLMGGQDLGELDDKLYAQLGKGQKKVVIDLGKTPWIYSASLCILLHHYIKFKEIGGSLKLANLTEKAQHVIVMSKLIMVFEIYDSLQAALDSFKEGKTA